MTSDSYAFSRQPKVTTSTVMARNLENSLGHRVLEEGRVEAALVLVFHGTGHQHVIVACAPLEVKVASWKRDLRVSVGPAKARRRNRRGAGSRAACPCEPRAAFPCPYPQVRAREHLGERDIGALR